MFFRKCKEPSSTTFVQPHGERVMKIKEFPVLVLGVALACMLNCAHAQRTYPEIDTLFNKGIALGNTNLDSSLSLARRIIAVSKEFKDEYGMVKGNMLAAHVFMVRFQLDTAKSLLLACEEYYQSNPKYYYTIDHGRVQLYQARVRGRKQEHRLARMYAAEARKIFHEIGDLRYEIEAVSYQGALESMMENFSQALTFYTKAVELKNESTDSTQRYTPDLLLNIANTYSRLGQYQRALEYGRKSLAMQVAKNDLNGIPNTLNSIGSFHNNLKYRDSAVYYFEKSKRIAEENNNSMYAFLAESNLANMYANAGEHKNAIRIVRNQLKRTAPLPFGMRENAVFILAKSLLKDNDPDSAILVSRPVFKKVYSQNQKQFVLQFSPLLTEAFERKKRFDSALYYSKITYAFKDSIYSIDNQKKLSTLYAEMETIASQKEIRLLKQQSELEQAENRILQVSIAFGFIATTMVIILLVLNHRNKQKKQLLVNYELRTELEQRKKDLHQQALRMIYINNGLADIEEGLKKIKTEANGKHQDIQVLLNSIHVNRSLEKEWDNFDAYFGNVHVGFYEKFNNAFPHLTILERRLAGLVRMNLTNPEIAGILNIENSSVKMAKYRLKKKLGLNDEQDFNQFLQTFG